MHTQDKPLAQKIDEQAFEKLLKYNPQTQNLWDIVGFFENEREKMRLEVAQYHEEIKTSKAKLKELREHITLAQNAIKALEQKHAQMPQDSLKNEVQDELKAQLRDLKSEYQLEENLSHIAYNHLNNENPAQNPEETKE